MSTKNSDKNALDQLSNPASERAVLAGIIRYGSEVSIEIEPLLNEETFTVPNNKVIFKCINSLLTKSRSIDFASLLSAAQDEGLADYFSRNDVLRHTQAIFETPINIDNVYEHAAKIRRLQFGREIQGKLRGIYQSISAIDGDETLAEIFSLAETPIQELSTQYLKEEQTTPSVLEDNLDSYIQDLIDNPSEMVGISTGYPGFDKAIGGGLRRKCVDVIGARAKAGKSLVGDNIAMHVAGKLNIPVLMLDTEMSKEDHFNRLLANISGIPINDIATGKFALHQETLDKVLAAKEKLKSVPYYYITIAGRPFDETLSIIRRWLMKEVGYDENSRLKDCLVVYDYLKLMSSSEMSGNDLKEFQLLGFQITALHNLCVKYDFPCLTFTQLNRDGISKESEDVVSGSDRIIWLCTSFSIFKAKTPEEIANDGIKNGNRKLIPVISRHGPGLEDGYICIQVDGELARARHLGTIKEITKSEKERQQGFPERVGDPENEVDDED